LRDVALAHDENHLARDVFGIEYPSQVVEKHLLLLGTAQNKYFLELVENEVYRFEKIEVQRAEAFENIRIEGEVLLVFEVDLLSERDIDVVVAPDEYVEPVGFLEAVGKPAFDDTGFPGPERAVYKHDIGLVDIVVDDPDFILSFKKSAAFAFLE
jgi:hypothetical protein